MIILLFLNICKASFEIIRKIFSSKEQLSKAKPWVCGFFLHQDMHASQYSTVQNKVQCVWQDNFLCFVFECVFVYLDVFVCILHVFAVPVSAVCVVQCAWCCHYCCNDSVPANGEPVLSLHKHFFPFLAANLIPFEILLWTGKGCLWLLLSGQQRCSCYDDVVLGRL